MQRLLKCARDSRYVLFSLVLLNMFVLSESSACLADELSPEMSRWGERYAKDILPIIQSRCIECHSGKDSDGEFDLSRFTSGDSAAKAGDVWDRVARRIRQNEMPPEGSPGLNDPQKGAFNGWLDSRPNQDLCNQLASDETQAWYRGHVMSRRLTRTEYRNAVKDLVGLELKSHELPPSDGAGGEGFDTVGDALFTSPIHLEAYLASADRIIETALPNTQDGAPSDVIAAREAILSEAFLTPIPKSDAERREAAKQCIQRFARRAWRRPVSEEEVERLLAIYDASLARSGTPLTALREPLKAVLVSPHFLFVVESEPDGGGVQRITEYQLATRLSLLIWSSIPDDRLLQLADEGKLFEESVLRQEVRRMLSDPKAEALGENFGLQWLGLREFGNGTRPDAEIFPEFSDALAADMREEAILTVANVFREDQPLTRLVDAQYIYANGRLAAYYGLAIEESADWQRVELPNRQRGGVMTMASVLTSASYPRRTSPVLRGRWILEEVLGSRVPPPPPNVPALEESHEEGKNLTLRERLEVHRQKAECASCHNRMDPLGFGLENFDGIGRWRESDNGQPIDSAGKLPSGDQFSGPEELKTVILKRSGEFQKHFVRKLIGFAYGRELSKFDNCVVDHCLKKLKENDLKAAVLIEEIALSYPFQHRYFKSDK
ncbi:hypothetical protein C5Y96_09475 [Blastopirellula marina]|uniref:Cytochrome c domain-containing protein n=1 Tax=Blastopirellula marina TaxID=124 RepID=A0A2S8FT80_9BACT|nr:MULTISPECIES: DUF1592 domain-containing protein [Pirellulaceae]PQO35260.1 hypothetical protein C5Y96_09475 [Blastopirellula marina]RCS53129.1 DUF1592 domain-containing protein [Bremerella cremea]